MLLNPSLVLTENKVEKKIKFYVMRVCVGCHLYHLISNSLWVDRKAIKKKTFFLRKNFSFEENYKITSARLMALNLNFFCEKKKNKKKNCSLHILWVKVNVFLIV